MPFFLDALIRRLKHIASAISDHARYDTQERLDRADHRISRMILDNIWKHAPDGSKNLDEYVSTDGNFSRQGQRPSVRQGLPAIRDSLWLSGYTNAYEDESAIFRRTGLEWTVEVSTDAPHATYFTKGIPEQWPGGTTPHTIPSAWVSIGVKRPLAFHLPGIPMGIEHWGVVGLVTLQQIDLDKHGDFVEEAWEEVKGDVDREINAALAESLGELRRAL
jgi:hypothetical protein